jgi:hypothetical protein
VTATIGRETILPEEASRALRHTAVQFVAAGLGLITLLGGLRHLDEL